MGYRRDISKDLGSTPLKWEDKYCDIDVLNRELEKAGEFHQHLCAGVTMGVKMGLYALQLLKYDEEYQKENLMVIAESPRCFADGIMSVTGCRVGKKSFILYDHGKISASFFSKITGEGIRLIDMDVRDQTDAHNTPELAERLKNIPNDEFFDVQRIQIDINKLNLKDAHYERRFCDTCGELVKDGKLEGDECYDCYANSYYSDTKAYYEVI